MYFYVLEKMWNGIFQPETNLRFLKTEFALFWNGKSLALHMRMLVLTQTHFMLKTINSPLRLFIGPLNQTGRRLAQL